MVPRQSDPPRPDDLTVAVLGQGSIGRRHASLLREIGCRVVAFDPSPEAVYQDGAEPAASEDEALGAAHAAVIASPTSEHVPQADRALSHGCHLLVEKPLARDDTGVADLLREARRSGRLLAVAMNLRFHPGPVAVREAVVSGRIGRPLTGRFTFGSYLPDWRPGTDYRRSYSARSELGGGVLLDVIHELDYAGWILGPPVEASGWITRVSDLEIDVEDVALAHVRYESGAVASFDLDYLDRSYRRGCRIVGSSGSVEWDQAGGTVALLGPEGHAERIDVGRDFAATYREQAVAWVEAVQRGDPELADTRLVDGAWAAGTLRLAGAIRSSAETGRVVRLG